MGFRFRKSIRLAPGVRLNFGKRGMSISAGVKGASVTLGSRGTYANMSIPGTGVSYRTRLGGASEARRLERQQYRLEREMQRLEAEQRRQKALSNVKLRLKDDGSMDVEDAFGNPLSRADMRLLWEQKEDLIREWLKTNTDEINGDVELLTRIHEDTPNANAEPEYVAQPFDEPKPEGPSLPTLEARPEREVLPPLGFFSRLFALRRKKHEQEYARLEQEYGNALKAWENRCAEKEALYQSEVKAWEQAIADWEARKSQHETNELQKAADYCRALREDLSLMNSMLEKALESLAWPRETLVDFAISSDSKDVWLDVDLPEIEDLPQRVASLTASERKLNIKSKSQKQLRQEYSTHIHGIAFRLAGTAFASLPSSEKVMVSGYSQRLDKATGKVDDDYLYSVVIDRQRFSQINFEALETIDPIGAIEVFELRRQMTSTGIFKAIEPFTPLPGFIEGPTDLLLGRSDT
jgi:Protein of unknown function (DUF4236)